MRASFLIPLAIAACGGDLAERNYRETGRSGDQQSSPSRPPAVPVQSSSDESVPAGYEEHVAALKKTLPAGFNVVVEPPFVVVGNQPPDMVAAEASRTVRWAVDHLRADFFDASPKQILDVWLFGDAASYEAGVTAL